MSLPIDLFTFFLKCSYVHLVYFFILSLQSQNLYDFYHKAKYVKPKGFVTLHDILFHCKCLFRYKTKNPI